MKKKYSLIGIDGNAFSVMGYVRSAMKKEGKSQDEINKYIEDAKSGDYNNILSASLDMVDKLNKTAPVQ